MKAQNYLRPPVYGLFHSAILVEREMIPDRASRSIVNWSQLAGQIDVNGQQATQMTKISTMKNGFMFTVSVIG